MHMLPQKCQNILCFVFTYNFYTLKLSSKRRLEDVCNIFNFVCRLKNNKRASPLY